MNETSKNELTKAGVVSRVCHDPPIRVMKNMNTLLATSILYLLFGIIFTVFAIQQVRLNGWGIFVFLLISLATIDTGAGLRYLMAYYRGKKSQEK